MSKTYVRKWSIFGSNTAVNTAGTVTKSAKSQVFQMTSTVSGGLNPRYKYAIAQGANATTTLTVLAQNLDVRPGNALAIYYQDPRYKASVNMDGLFPFSPAPNWVTPSSDGRAQTSATRALYAKIRDVQNQFQGGVFLGELHQTVALVMKPVNAIASLTLKYLTKQKRLIAKRGKMPKGSFTKRFTGNYLEWTFGVAPLVSDIRDLSLTIQRAMVDPPRVKFKAVGVADSSQLIDYGPTYVGFLANSRTEVRINRTTVKYYGQFRGIAQPSGIAEKAYRVAQLSGFTLNNFAPTVWNLIPFSFVADYFINIGDMLEAASTDTSVVSWLSRTEVNQQISDFRMSVDPAATKAAGAGWTFDVISGSPGGYVATSTAINRAAATVPYLTPAFKIENNFGRHIANLVALVANRISH